MREYSGIVVAKYNASLLSETLAAKETKNRLACHGNHLGCCAEKGLQCGLSGNPVPMLATYRCGI